MDHFPLRTAGIGVRKHPVRDGKLRLQGHLEPFGQVYNLSEPIKTPGVSSQEKNTLL